MRAARSISPRLPWWLQPQERPGVTRVLSAHPREPTTQESSLRSRPVRASRQGATGGEGDDAPAFRSCHFAPEPRFMTGRKSPADLRSARWFAPDDFRSFGHRSRMNQIGYAVEEFVGKPIIGIINTWSEFAQCHAHFKQRVDDIKRGVLQAGGFPVELPAISPSGRTGEAATILYRHFLPTGAAEPIPPP